MNNEKSNHNGNNSYNSNVLSENNNNNILSGNPGNLREIVKMQPKNHRYLRYSSLAILAIQNATLVLIMRYARTMPGEKFYATTAVVMAEAVKLVACFFIISYNEGGVRGLIRELDRNIINAPMDTLKVAVPGLIYTFQNNLLYVAVSNLPAATFQVVYQIKILTTALFSVIMLDKKLSIMHWFALVVLTTGVAMVQIETTLTKDTSKDDLNSNQNPILGFVAVLIACLSSGFAGVYFEKILKGSPVSTWLRNIQLAIFGIVLGMIAVYINDGANVLAFGFFHGYNQYTIMVILNQALGGLVVAFVVKYADNILKGFATSIAIIISCVCSIFLFSFEVSAVFLMGATLVIGSVCLYSSR
ncbi:UDP-N-acetylglucosamine transporter-like [Symsagittifera roscoffensis]|uniref:UDP-N-acetylglucosamine transporter-like n=1 Tax=Symsagittifera roscoffensis TaxID=84072 RepID=UPI00307C8065